jgi:predicted transcriptional regulator
LAPLEALNLEFIGMIMQRDQYGGAERTGQVVAAMVAAPLQRTCSPFSTVTEAVLIFKDEDCEMVPVVDEGRPVGLITDRDVALAVPDIPGLAEEPVSRIMTRAVLTVSTDAPVDEVIEKMITANTQTVFVVDGNSRLEGLISWADLAGRMPLGALTDIVEPVTGEVSEP